MGAALLQASRSGHIEVVELLLARGAPPTAATADSPCDTALLLAATGGHEKVVRALLAAGAPPDSPEPGHTGPLHAAAQAGAAGCVDALLSAGADVEARREDGCAALHIAAEVGAREVLVTLLEKGRANASATIDGGPPHGASALLRACANGRLECVQLLSAYGAERSIRVQAPGKSRPGMHPGSGSGKASSVSSYPAPARTPSPRRTNFSPRASPASAHAAHASPRSGHACSSHRRGGAISSPAPKPVAGSGGGATGGGGAGAAANEQLPSSAAAPPHVAGSGSGGVLVTAEQVSRDAGQRAVATWLSSTRDWTSALHHAPLLPEARVRALLAARADPHARAAGGRQSALEVARMHAHSPSAKLVIAAAEGRLSASSKEQRGRASGASRSPSRRGFSTPAEGAQAPSSGSLKQAQRRSNSATPPAPKHAPALPAVPIHAACAGLSEPGRQVGTPMAGRRASMGRDSPARGSRGSRGRSAERPRGSGGRRSSASRQAPPSPLQIQRQSSSASAGASQSPPRRKFGVPAPVRISDDDFDDDGGRGAPSPSVGSDDPMNKTTLIKRRS